MTRIAFYAPLKSPDHPTPSGDREMARNLMVALHRALGWTVTLASELRSFEPKGNATVQQSLRDRAQKEILRLTQNLRGCALWVTYHNYYKAPDLIGPAVAKALSIPYVLIEATRAQSRMNGPWAGFARQAEAASDAAEVIFHFTAQDREALARDRPDHQKVIELPPFLNRDDLPAQSACDGPMLSVGMMRPGDKLASYGLIAKALTHLDDMDWRLDIAGDGPARRDTEAMFTPFKDRVRFLSALDAPALQEVYQSASLLLWPGVNEAFGMTYLEAQATGLPVVAQNRPGVRDVLAPGSYPTPEEGISGLAERMRVLLKKPTLRKSLGHAARAHVADRHLRPAAVNLLRETLLPLVAPL